MGKKKLKRKTKNTAKAKQDNLSSWLIYAVIALGILLRLIFPILNTGLWHDECALAINILDRGFWGLFNPLRFLQVAPPLFLSAVKLVILGNSPYINPVLTDFLLRVIPLFSGISAIFVFYYLLKTLFINRYIQLTGLILFAFNPVLIQYSYELKPYSSDVLISILLILYFIKYNPDSYWKQFYQILIISCVTLFSFPAAFIITGGIASILFKDYKKFFCALTAFILVLIFYFVYHLWGVMETHGAGMDRYWAAYFITGKNILNLVLFNIKSSFNIFIMPLVSLGIVTAGLAAAIIRNRNIAIISGVVFLSLITASYLHLYPFVVRMLLFSLPLLILLVCELCDLFPSNLQLLISAAIFVLCGYYLFIMNEILINKINTRTNYGIKELAAAVNSNGYSVVIPKNSNVEWIYYSRFYDFDTKKVYFQEWNTPDKEWLKTIPQSRYYYFAPFETKIPDFILKKSSGVIKLGSRGIILKID